MSQRTLKPTRPRGRPRYEDILTPREWQVFDLMAEGLTNEEIASRMGISHSGVKFHVAEILSKLGVHSRAQAIAELQEQRRRPVLGFLPSFGAYFDRMSGAGKLGLAGVAVAALVALAGAGFLLASDSGSGGGDSSSQVAAGDGDLSHILADFQDSADATAPVAPSDPFAYCQAVGTENEPGPEAAGFQDELQARVADAEGMDPAPPFDWRCADGRVLYCIHGNGLPCWQGDDSREPNEGVINYCEDKSHPAPPEGQQDVVPSFAAGKDTIYSWACGENGPEITEQRWTLDRQGFISEFWSVLLP